MPDGYALRAFTAADLPMMAQWLAVIDAPEVESGFVEPLQVYHTDVGMVANTIQGFAKKRETNFIDEVGVGLTRALYATYVSTLPTEKFGYDLVSHVDPRGAFSEIIKTENCGQFSYFTALPGQPIYHLRCPRR